MREWGMGLGVLFEKKGERMFYGIFIQRVMYV